MSAYKCNAVGKTLQATCFKSCLSTCNSPCFQLNSFTNFAGIDGTTNDGF